MSSAPANQAPLRILHVVATYLPATRYGGPIESVHGLARAQAKLGAQVSVVTTSVDGPGNSPVPHGQAVELDGVQVWYFRSTFLRRIYFSWSMWRWLRREIARFDVVHLHAVYLFPITMAARVCVAAGVPYVIAPRGMLVGALIDGKSRWIKKAWIALWERKTLAQAAFIHATARSEAEEIKRLGLMLAPTHVLMNGVGTNLEQSGLAEPSGLAAVQPYLLYLGRISPKKNIDLLVRALTQVQGLHLVIVGVDEMGTQGQLESLTQSLALQTRVHFLGERLGQEKWRWIAHAKALALVSVNENFGNSVAEAMLAGVPVIVSQGVGLAQWIGEKSAGWVCASTVEGVVSALQALNADPQRAAHYAANGQRFAREQLAWDAIAGKSLQLYRNICRKQ